MELARTLAGFRADAAADPTGNPVERLAADLARRIDIGEVGLDALEDLIAHLTCRSVRHRARTLAAYLDRAEDAVEEEALRAWIRAEARPGGGQTLPFEAFRDRFERVALGIVITAHPTFGMPQDLTRTIARLSAGAEDAETAAVLDRVRAGEYGPPEDLSLAGEHAFAAAAIANIRHAVRRIYAAVLDVAAEVYDHRWTELVPGMVTLATWVGYDMDGRADIAWTDTIRIRLGEEAAQLNAYLAALREVAQAAGADPLAQVTERLAALRATVAGDLAAVPDNPADVEAARRFNQRLAGGRADRLVRISVLLSDLDAAFDAVPPEAACALAVLRAEMARSGLTTAGVHVRVNATQLTNAIRKEVGIDTAPDASGDRRRYLGVLNRLLDEVESVTFNFGSILAETMSARRMFMLVGQMLKYVDAETPVRFLIAEADTTFTALSALYFARLFGIEDQIDICPLFETAKALERGHEVMDELLGNPQYRAYVLRRRRLCIETGFSDAGRYMGQIAAGLAIERLRIKLAEVFARHGLQDDVELVIFDTHGESIGRGRHPASFSERLDYIYPPASRQALAAENIRVKHELSFQGGDGYVFFATPELAFVTVARLVRHTVAGPAPADDIRARDRFYADVDYSLDFFLTLKAFNEQVTADPDYGAIAEIGGNLLYRTGSRAAKRQRGGERRERSEITRIRAIPHNGMLQQLGYLANSAGAVGTAIAKDPERFAEVLRGSPRCRSLLALAAAARELSSVDAFSAYLALFSPTRWLLRARGETLPERRQWMQRLARALAASGRHERLSRIGRIFLDDAVEFEAALARLEADDDSLVPAVLREVRPDLDLLHAVRICLIQEIFLHAARVPPFTAHEGVTVDEVVEEILGLEVSGAVAVLREAFPLAAYGGGDESFGEPASYQPLRTHGYEAEHRELFDPMTRCHALSRRISVAVSHLMSAVG